MMVLICGVLFCYYLRRMFSLRADVNPSLSTSLSESVPVCIVKNQDRSQRRPCQSCKARLTPPTHYTGPPVRAILPCSYTQTRPRWKETATNVTAKLRVQKKPLRGQKGKVLSNPVRPIRTAMQKDRSIERTRRLTGREFFVRTQGYRSCRNTNVMESRLRVILLQGESEPSIARRVPTSHCPSSAGWGCSGPARCC